MPGWNFADDVGGRRRAGPRRTAQVQGDRRITLARLRPARQRHRPGASSTPACRSRTRSPSTSTTAPSTSSRCYASFKAGLAPVNTNYRYLDDELVYLWDNGDVRRRRVPRHLHRAHRAHPRPAPAGQAVALGRRRQRPVPRVGHALRGRRGGRHGRARRGPWGRDGDHLLLLYTGGTTGMPKGVMWRQDDLFRSLVGTFLPGRAATPSPTYSSSGTPCRRPGSIGLPACPLMHGTGLLHPADRAVGRRLHGHPREPQPRHRGAVRRRSSASRSTPSPSWATPSPSRCCAPSTPRPAGRTSRASCMVSTSGVMFSEASSRRCSPTTPG